MHGTRLKLHSEPYARTGSIGDAGFRKLLGKPHLDMMQVVVREALQNCCDAAKLGTGPEVMIRLRRLDAGQKRAIAEQVLWDLPECPGSRDHLLAFRDADAPIVLEICDFGTTGLGGPTRADRIPEGDVPTDFTDFLRNVGTSRDTHHGGGTFGFGKVSLYLASTCSMILVDTLPSVGERRMMGCHLGPSFRVAQSDGSRRPFTGRHWWGEACEEDHFVEPLSGNPARDLSAALGMPKRGEGRTGTSIMILHPHLEDESLEVAGRRIAEAVLWNFWPRMMADVDPSHRVTVSVVVDDMPILVPSPEEFPPLDLFCKAMRKVRAREDDAVSIDCQRPIKHLGRLAIVRGLKAKRVPLVEENSLMPVTASHIAVMRPVELVVRTYEGDPLPDGAVEWAGVFVVDDDDEVERAFAAAEPPAHDDWDPNSLPKGKQKTFVNVAVREIRKAAKAVAAPVSGTADAQGGGAPLAKVAGVLGRALDGTSTDGAGPRGRGGGGGGRAKRPRASRPVFVRLERGGSGPVAVFETTVTDVPEGSPLRLAAEPALALEGSALRVGEADEGGPEIIGIARAGGDLAGDGRSIPLEGGSGTYEIRVAMPGDAAAVVGVRIEDGDTA